MGNFASTEKAAGDTITAANNNAVRKDAVVNAGDYVTATGSANAYAVSLDSAIVAYAAGLVAKFKANFTNTGAATLNVNSLGAKNIYKMVNGTLSALSPSDIYTDQIVSAIYDGTQFQLLGSPQMRPERINTICANNSAGSIDETASTFQALLNDDTRLLMPNGSTATTLDYKKTLGASKNIPGFNTAQRAGQPANIQVGCRAKDTNGVDYLLWAADAGATLYRNDSDGQNNTTITFSGTAPTNISRIGWDPANNYVVIMDAANKAGTTLRRYTFTGSTLTYVDAITLSAAPANAGCSTMLIGPTYIVIHETATASSAQFKRYDLTGTAVDTITLTGAAGQNRGFVISAVWNAIYMSTITNNAVAAYHSGYTLVDIG